MYHFKTRIIENCQFTANIACLRIEAPESFCQHSTAGRFVMLGSDDGLFDPLLKRPFGICNWGVDWFDVVIKTVGKGSKQLCQLQTDALVTVHGPLGNGYPDIDISQLKDKSCNPIIFLAGGMGIASIASCLLPVCNEEVEGHISTDKILLFGAANRNELVLVDEIKKHNPNLRIETITDDGSSGRQGFVTELLDAELKSNPEAVTFACGPEPMLKSVQNVLEKHHAQGWLSLENRMACGFGVCLGCVQKLSVESGEGGVRSAKVCTQGPVFPAAEVIF